MMAPAVPQILKDFHDTDDTAGTFVVSVFVLGFAFGPLVIAPASELHGRLVVYHVCNCLFILFTIGCALSTNMGMLVAFRFWAGFAGVCVLTCGSGTIVDMMPAEIRGKAMGLWSLGPLIGPVIGPVCAGFLVAAKSWPWVFWVIAMVVCVFVLLFSFFFFFFSSLFFFVLYLYILCSCNLHFAKLGPKKNECLEIRDADFKTFSTVQCGHSVLICRAAGDLCARATRTQGSPTAERDRR